MSSASAAEYVEDYAWEVEINAREQDAYERAYLLQRQRELALWEKRLTNSTAKAHPPAP